MIIDTTQAPFDPVEYFFSLDGKAEATEAEKEAFLEGFKTGIFFMKTNTATDTTCDDVQKQARVNRDNDITDGGSCQPKLIEIVDRIVDKIELDQTTYGRLVAIRNIVDEEVIQRVVYAYYLGYADGKESKS